MQSKAWGLVLITLLAGCTSAPPERPAPIELPAPIDIEVEEPEPEPAKPAPAPEKTCNWKETRGVAEVVALNPTDAEFRFYPGDIRVPVPEDQHFETGQEFKALLRRAEGCDAHLEVIDSVHGSEQADDLAPSHRQPPAQRRSPGGKSSR